MKFGGNGSIIWEMRGFTNQFRVLETLCQKHFVEKDLQWQF